MKVLPVIICGGAGTRLFKESKDNLPKQFIDFGGWTMFQKTLERVNSKLFLPPIIVKRMFAAVGNRVNALHREAIGEINLDVQAGQWRYI